MIRLATEKDLEALHALQAQPETRDAGYLWRAALRDRIRAGHIRVIDLDREPAGYAIGAARRDQRYHITQVIVAPTLWEHGYGSQLMRAHHLAALRSGSRALTVKCATDARAHTWWPLLGLTRVGTMQGERRKLAAWSRALGPRGALMMPPRSRRPGRIWH